ncbi:MAG: MopE-related protein [Myxococcota bacterium]|nr:MopE-related protein [Myxococcota bacterium]
MKSPIQLSLLLAGLMLGFTACSESEKSSGPSTEDTSSEDSGAEDSDTDNVEENPNDADGDGYIDINMGGDDCDDADPTLTPQDADQDGFSSCQGDCDDDDAFTYPGAANLEFSTSVVLITGNNTATCSSMGYRELTESECIDYAKDMGLFFEEYDGTLTDESGCIESDGSGIIEYLSNSQEEPCPSGYTCYCIEETPSCMRDEDGDGYGSTDPSNPNIQAGTDCNDTEPTVNPDGFDEGTDGLDQNCDGIDEAQCVNDDSFVDYFGETGIYYGDDLTGITGCDNIFEELDWIDCGTPLYWVSIEWVSPYYGDGDDPTGLTLLDYCGCQCPTLGQEPPYCVTLTMTDSGGDGWNGGSLYIDMVTYTMESGSEKSYEVCYFEIDGCTRVAYNEGEKPEENAWEITYGDYVVGSSENEDRRIGQGCTPLPNTCETCQSIGPERMFCGEGNFSGMFGGCATVGNGWAECTDGRDEIPGGRFTCVPYNYIPPE